MSQLNIRFQCEHPLFLSFSLFLLVIVLSVPDLQTCLIPSMTLIVSCKFQILIRNKGCSHWKRIFRRSPLKPRVNSGAPEGLALRIKDASFRGIIHDFTSKCFCDDVQHKLHVKRLERYLYITGVHINCTIPAIRHQPKYYDEMKMIHILYIGHY
jgi:hypothetical protein